MEGIQPGTSTYPYGPQFVPQGSFGNLLNAPLGGVIGSGIGGLFTNPSAGRQIVDGMSAPFHNAPFYIDPVTAAQLQQAQLIRQAQLALQAQLAQQQAPYAQQIPYAQQAPYAQQIPYAQLGSALPQAFPGNVWGMPGQTPGGQFGNPLVGLWGRVSPFGVDPVTAMHHALFAQQLAQQALLTPHTGQPIGNVQGGGWGYPQLGAPIGGLAGQWTRPLPFVTSPFQTSPFQTSPFQTAPFGVTGGYIPGY